MKRFLVLLLASFLFVMPAVSAGAAEIDVLLEKLVEKGVLTPLEAQIVKDETAQEVSTQIAQGKMDTMPSWIQTVKLKGDVRLRYQTQQKKGSTTQNRGRARLRLGIEAKPVDQFTVGAGLASGSDSDARSTNETLGDGFAKDGIYLDYVWAEYKPEQWVSMIGGKYNANGKNYLWYTTDMLWDSDINQEGASAHFDIPRILNGDAFVNAGYWALSEASGDAHDAGMFYSQAGMKYAVNAGLQNPLDLKVAGTYYSKQFNDSGSALSNGKDTQTAANNQYDYNNVYAGSAELIYKWPEETSSPIKMVGIFSDYVNNPDADSENTGWATGFKFGHPKVDGSKTWQLKYQYVRLGNFAWIDIFPDSDRYSGRTNVKGHEVILELGLAKNVSLGFDYYHTDVIKGTSLPEDLFQTDLSLKF